MVKNGENKKPCRGFVAARPNIRNIVWLKRKKVGLEKPDLIQLKLKTACSLRHCVEPFGKTALLVGGCVLFKNALRNCAVDNRAGGGEHSRCGFLVTRFFMAFLTWVLTTLFLMVFFSVTRTRFFADFMLGTSNSPLSVIFEILE